MKSEMNLPNNPRHSLNKTVTHPVNILFLVVSLVLSAAFSPHAAWAQDGAISNLSYEADDDFTVDDEWDEYEDVAFNDPFENYNRKMFRFNDKVYRHVFSPLAKGFDFMFPKKIQGSFNNVVRFTMTPKRFFNNLLQKKFKSSFIEFERLLINASVGIGGLFDPADRVFHLEQQNEDFGQTLGFYGVKPGPYIIWPIIGPSTRRDTIGTGGDNVFSVFFWFSIYDVQPEDAFRAFSATKRVNNYTYNVRSNYERITESAIDPYIALQHAYIKNREKMIKE
jgi:phospholipid-binding lipoprotein MlaA